MMNHTLLTTAVPVAASNKSLTHRVATPSRRRRIIYETARRITRQYINDAIHNAHCTTSSSRIIQFQWRKYKFSVRVRLRYQNNAAIRIQKLFSLYQQRLQLQRQKDMNIRNMNMTSSSKTITKFFRQSLIKIKAKANLSFYETAVIMIQKNWRGTMARNVAQEYKLSLLEMECSAIVIQSFVRSYIAKVAFARRHFPPCALLIQRYYRLYLVRKREKERIVKDAAIGRLQLWWRKMIIVKSLMRYVMEEIRLRSLMMNDNSNDETKSESSVEVKSNGSCDNYTGAEGEDGLFSFDDLLNGEEKDNLSGFDFKSDSSSIHTTEEVDTNILDTADDEKSTCSILSSQSTSRDRIDREMREAIELEYKRNQAAIMIQLHLKAYVYHLQEVRRKKQEQLQLRIQNAAMIMTRELWILYQDFIKRRERIKREMKTKAVIKIQSCIRSHIAIRFVQNYREAMYNEILDIYHTEFRCYDAYNHIKNHNYGNNNNGNEDEQDFLSTMDLELPSFLTREGEDDGDDEYEGEYKHNQDEEGDNYKSSTTKADKSSPSSSFHDEWVGMLPATCRRVIPKGCNLHGIDLDDEDSLIRCLTLNLA